MKTGSASLSAYIRKFRDFIRQHETVKSLLIIAIIILGALAVWGGIRLALNAEYPILVVSSGSMCPPTNCVLPIGSLIVIRGLDPSTISVGTIIVFRPDPYQADYLVVHRVLHLYQPGVNSSQTPYPNEYSFETHGDANYPPNQPDAWGPVPASRLVGVYQFTIPIPYLGSAILWIRSFLYGNSCDLQPSCQLTSQGLFVIILLVASLFLFELIEPSKKSPSKKSVAKEPTSPEPLPSPSEPAGSTN